MAATCEYSKLCRNKPSHRILTKHGDFSVCRKHAKEAETNKDVRYITPLKKVGK